MKKAPSKVDALRKARERQASGMEIVVPPPASAAPHGIDKANAPLPQMYESARYALSECVRVDECKDWADKAAALASYAKQADDDRLMKTAMRIQARAIRRAGELLETFNKGVGRPKENGTGADTISQRKAAERAGMSKRQEVTAVRVANVPETEFEEAVEGDKPPTVTALAEKGKKGGVTVMERNGGKAPPGFKEATNLLGSVDRFAEFCHENPPESVASGVMDYEEDGLRKQIRVIAGWLDEFTAHLGT